MATPTLPFLKPFPFPFLQMSQIPSIHTLNTLLKKDLLHLCGVHNISVSSRATKAELIELLNQQQMREEKCERELDMHRQSRFLGPRKATEVCANDLEEPFDFLEEYGGPRAIQRPLLGQEDVDVGDFPNNVEEYLWTHEGINDYEPWYAVARLNNGSYVFFKAECVYTGFDCQGDMFLWAAKDLATLVNYAMDVQDYDAWIKGTEPV